MMRFFEMGWTMFTPCHNLIYHLWERDYRPTFAKESRTRNVERQQACLALIKERIFWPTNFPREKIDDFMDNEAVGVVCASKGSSTI